MIKETEHVYTKSINEAPKSKTKTGYGSGSVMVIDGKEMTDFIKSLFNSTFKTNPYLECAIMTGITRISKESIFQM